MRRFGVLAVLSGLFAALLTGCHETPDTVVGISGSNFTINGSVTNPSKVAEGMLLNSRMIQGIWDDANLDTQDTWAYPNTGVWDPERNTDEFTAQFANYADKGLKAITVGMQGGCPQCFGGGINGANKSSGFTAAGAIKVPWADRLKQVLHEADVQGIVVIVSLFYRAQDERLTDNAAVEAAVDNTVDLILEVGAKNVLLEIANENNLSTFDHSVLQTTTGQVGLINRAKFRASGTIKVSNSYTSNYTLPDSVVSAVDYVTLHGNDRTPSEITSMTNIMRLRTGKPIIFNEDSTDFDNMQAAVVAGASWGYYDQGANNYVDGFQSPPVKWSNNTTTKQGFFNLVYFYTNAAP